MVDSLPAGGSCRIRRQSGVGDGWVVKGGGVLQPQGWHLARLAGFENLEELDFLFENKPLPCLFGRTAEHAPPRLPL